MKYLMIIIFAIMSLNIYAGSGTDASMEQGTCGSADQNAFVINAPETPQESSESEDAANTKR